MKKSDLRSGDIVEIRGGEKYIVLLNTAPHQGHINVLINLKNGWDRLEDYSEDLIHPRDSYFDIMKVCHCGYAGHNLRIHAIIGGSTPIKEPWTWVREDEINSKENQENATKLIEAMKMIKTVCKSHDRCGGCPFYRNDWCVISSSDIELWDGDEDKIRSCKIMGDKGNG